MEAKFDSLPPGSIKVVPEYNTPAGSVFWIFGLNQKAHVRVHREPGGPSIAAVQINQEPDTLYVPGVTGKIFRQAFATLRAIAVSTKKPVMLQVETHDPNLKTFLRENNVPLSFPNVHGPADTGTETIRWTSMILPESKLRRRGSSASVRMRG